MKRKQRRDIHQNHLCANCTFSFQQEKRTPRNERKHCAVPLEIELCTTRCYHRCCPLFFSPLHSLRPRLLEPYFFSTLFPFQPPLVPHRERIVPLVVVFSFATVRTVSLLPPMSFRCFKLPQQNSPRPAFRSKQCPDATALPVITFFPSSFDPQSLQRINSKTLGRSNFFDVALPQNQNNSTNPKNKTPFHLHQSCPRRRR